MRKVLSLLVASLAFCAVAQAKWFVGIEAGYAVQSDYGLSDSNIKMALPWIDATPEAIRNGTRGYSLGASLGYEGFYWKYVGTRNGLGVGYTSIYSQGFAEHAESFQAESFSDLMVNFFHNGSSSVGVFVGVGVVYNYVLSRFEDSEDVTHVLDVGWRMGVSTMLDNHHRVDLIAKLPSASIGLDSGFDRLDSFARTSFVVGYRYIF
ncbi:hypothetical protein BBW65_03625 [Helicobacter enhydrae]|uniref:Outer membrane protein n=1 Tax=Helicobacter enhydrae TaxID=222136 RepID=A0A1B1U5G9_9HELI|nr:outer membrane beta-barrel protein [Helicobacter enhydrae]ANV97942.1 hypothetical protein BBW65_03625 [Helicobacter enhydrae]